MVVCFLTDFGLQDDFVGTCHGVIARIAPDARVIDVTHGIPPQAVLQGALVLAEHAAVHAGRGPPRRRRPRGGRRATPVVLRDDDGRMFVGPDNGLLLPAGERAGIAEVRELANPAYALHVDLAHLSRPRPVRTRGRAPCQRSPDGELGPPLAADALVRLDLPQPVFDAGIVDGTMLYVDSFGNVALNLTRDDIERIGIVPGTRVELEVDGPTLLRRRRADVRRRPSRRRDPVRGQLPQHVRRHLERLRRRDAARLRRQDAPHSAVAARKLGRDAGNPLARAGFRTSRSELRLQMARAGLEPATPRFSAVCSTMLPRPGGVRQCS